MPLANALYGLSSNMLAIVIAALVVYTALVAAAGFGFGRIDRANRRFERLRRVLSAEREQPSGAHTRYTLDLAPDDVQEIPDLGMVLSHRKGRRL